MIDNLLDTLRRAHCDNAQQAYYAKRHRGQSHSTMPATSFVFEFFLFNSLYQYDWAQSFDQNALVPWGQDELSESAQQARLEKFVRDRCRANPSILRRAFDPISQLEDLDGDWTRITPDARISIDQGNSFFAKLSKLRNLLRSENETTASRSFFDLISGCRYFVYLVRNNIFHGSKSIGEIYERDQRRRIEVYDIFLKSLVSLFFLAVEKTPVAADYVQLPIRIIFQSGEFLNIGQSQVVDLVASGCMKPEDSRLIAAFVSRCPVPSRHPSARDALFYPSSGRDLITPILLGLPYCTQFFFYDIGQPTRARALEKQLPQLLNVRVEKSGDNVDESLRFDFLGVSRTIHLVRADNRGFLDRDVDLTFYFHRGDSPGEGGSGQRWDSLHVVDLGDQVEGTRMCQILTDGEPGGLHPDLRSMMQTASIPISQRGRDYFLGAASGDCLKEMDKTEQCDTRKWPIAAESSG